MIKVQEKTDHSSFPHKPNDYITWSILNLCCCFCGFAGLLCSVPAVVFSYKIHQYVEIDLNDLEKLEAYSRCARRLNFFASLFYIAFFVSIFILVIVFLIHFNLFSF